MQFWCSASDTAWTWTWRAYPGVWLFVALIAFLVLRWNRVGARRAGRQPGPAHPLFFVGLLTLWLALDWPIGALGASHLSSVHMLQFILVSLVAPPALLRGPGAAAFATFESPSFAARAFRRLTSPVLALILFNVSVLVTHLPVVVDGLMPSQLGSFAIDLLWLASGLIFWWPLVAPAPAHPTFVPPLRMLYLVIGLMFSPIMFGLVGFMVYAQHPLYGIYELAPPIGSMTAHQDLQVAGTLMSVMGALVAFIGLSVIFFRWSAKDG